LYFFSSATPPFGTTEPGAVPGFGHHSLRVADPTALPFEVALRLFSGDANMLRAFLLCSGGEDSCMPPPQFSTYRAACPASLIRRKAIRLKWQGFRIILDEPNIIS
jgi:hypothetical protein